MVDIPPQGHLRSGLAVLFADLSVDGVGEDAVLPIGQGPPGHGLDSVLLHQPRGLRLLEERVQLHLVDGGSDLDGFADIGQHLVIYALSNLLITEFFCVG